MLTPGPVPQPCHPGVERGIFVESMGLEDCSYVVGFSP